MAGGGDNTTAGPAPAPVGGPEAAAALPPLTMRASSTWTLVTGEPGAPEDTPDRGTPSPPLSSSFLCPFLPPLHLSLALLWAAARINFSEGGKREQCPVTAELKARCLSLNMNLVGRVL